MNKSFLRILSYLLTISLLISVCFISANFNVLAQAKIIDYYVGYGGTGDGSSLQDMAPSVVEAIKTINNNGLVAGDTANIWIVQDIASLQKNANDYNHNLAVWGANSSTSHVPMVEHTAKIVIKPYKENQKNNSSVTETYLALGDKYTSQYIIAIGGPTEFEDVTLVYTSKSNFSNSKSIIVANGYDLKFGKGVRFGNIAINTDTNWETFTPTVDYRVGAYGSIAADGITEPFTNQINLVYKNKLSYGDNRINIPAYNKGTYTFKEDVTVEMTGENNKVYVSMGTKSASSTITYEKNLNFKLEGYVRFRNNSNYSKSIIGGGLQLIVSQSATIDDATYPITNMISTCCKNDGTTPADSWLLKVPSDYIDDIGFLNGETGKFRLYRNAEVVATNIATGEVVKSIGDVLDLSQKSGEYNLEFKILSNEKTMLYFEKTKVKDNQALIQKTEKLEANVEYTLTYDYKYLSGIYGTSYFALYGGVTSDGKNMIHKIPYFSTKSSVGEAFKTVEDDGRRLTVTFELSEQQIAENENFYIGLRFLPNAYMITEAYIANMVLYKTDDKNKTNLFLSGNYELETNNWYSTTGYSSDKNDLVLGKPNSYLTIKYLPYEADYFESPEYIHYGDTDFDGKIGILDLVSTNEVEEKMIF
jgi:hypothetical protein